MKKGIVILLFGLLFVFSGCNSKTPELTVAETVEKGEEIERIEEEATSIIPSEIENEAGAEGDFNTSAPALKEMFAKWDASFEGIFLEDMVEVLVSEKIKFTARYNKSGERVDLELEDGTRLLFLRVTDSDMNDLGYKLIMKDGVLDSGSFQEQYLNSYDVIRFDYYAPELSEQIVDENWLVERNQTDLSIIRNELYAKYGRTFNDPFLQAVFNLKEWYHPVYSPQEFDAAGQDFLTEIEKKNLARITEYEINAGYRKKSGDTTVDVWPLLSGSWCDLDGNGILEQIFYQVEKDAYGDSTEVVLSVSTDEEIATEATAMERRSGWNLHDNCYIFSVDGIKQYLVLADYGISHDNEMFIYEYVAGELKEVGTICDDPTAIKVYSDHIEASERYDHICSQYITFTYVLENGNFVQKEETFYEYFYYGNLTARQEFVLHTQKDSSNDTITVKKGEKLEMLGGDLEEWILFKKTESGEEGWLYVNSCKCMLPDGSMVYSEQLLDGLAFFG